MPKKQVEALNIPKIAKAIREKHSKFIEKVGMLPVKISADKELEMERICAKIKRILECFVSEKIIDQITVGDTAKFFSLQKNGFREKVYIYIEDTNIFFIDMTERQIELCGTKLHENIEIRNVDVDKLDWVDFSTKLLDYIHQVIYSRSESILAKIFKEQ
jgi:hypothetical protein